MDRQFLWKRSWLCSKIVKARLPCTLQIYQSLLFRRTWLGGELFLFQRQMSFFRVQSVHWEVSNRIFRLRIISLMRLGAMISRRLDWKWRSSAFAQVFHLYCTAVRNYNLFKKTGQAAYVALHCFYKHPLSRKWNFFPQWLFAHTYYSTMQNHGAKTFFKERWTLEDEFKWNLHVFANVVKNRM